ncbi:MAG: asparaginase, partial [Firmicutes bacterium]|nr:asparaginase [Bacillota bacterium]
MKKKKILVLATGGTIASAPSPDGLVPTLDVSALLSGIAGVAENYELTAKDILSMDSSNIQPEEWVL